jgi:hypothetical protein
MELERSVVLTYLLLARKRRGAWGTDSDRCSGLGVRWVIREKAVCPASFLGGVSCVARYEFDMHRWLCAKLSEPDPCRGASAANDRSISSNIEHHPSNSHTSTLSAP